MPVSALPILLSAPHVVAATKARGGVAPDLAFAELPAVAFVIDAAGRIIEATRLAGERLGYPPGGLAGLRLPELAPAPERAALEAELRACLGDAGRTRRWRMSAARRDGARLHLELSARVAGDGSWLVVVAADASEVEALAQRLDQRRFQDDLTDLPNRLAFEQCLARRELRGGGHAVLWLDVDQFTVINHTCGHQAGDELLRALAGLLRRRLRAGDFLARVGGDSFAVLLEGCGASQALRVTELLERAIADFRFRWKDGVHPVHVSIGVAPIDGREIDVERILQVASGACRVAKERGAGRVHVYDGHDDGFSRHSEEIEWVSRIERALAEDRFVLCLQPIRAMRGGPGAGRRYEILLRMLDEAGDLIAPGAFLPAAERYHLASRIDRWVVRAVLAWLEAHPSELARLDMCFVNLSARSLGDERFLEGLLTDLEISGIPGEKLCFEVTETAAIANLVQAARCCQALRERGCRFALDDFGSGVSSFAYLRTLPVDFLKIDGMFVRDVIEDPVALATVRSIHEIGHLMGKQTIAEFVESQEILDKVREIGLDFVQGYSIGRPCRLVA